MVPERVILRAENISKSFNDFKALKNVSFEVSRGEVVAILGPSGGGKTVLLRCLAGLEPVTSGKIEYFPNGEDLVVTFNGNNASADKVFGRISMVFQDLHLWPHMTVLQNIIYAPIFAKGISHKEAVEQAHEICGRLGVEDQLKKYPRELSIGQQQRAAIARTLAMEPELILLDEITSALDPERSLEIAKVVESLAKMGMTMLIVTHHIWLAEKVADKFVFLFHGEINEQTVNLKEELILSQRVKAFLNANKQIGGIYDGLDG